MRISGSLNLPQPVTEEVAAATSSWWPPRLRCNDPCGNSARGTWWENMEFLGKDGRKWDNVNWAKHASGHVAKHDGVRLVAIPGHGFKSQHIKMIKHIKRTNASSGLFERGVTEFPWLQALNLVGECWGLSPTLGWSRCASSWRASSVTLLCVSCPIKTAYWVCAYANNQHQLENEICNNPRKTSFYRAIQLCAGVLLVLDENATPFTRTFAWKLGAWVGEVWQARLDP